MSLLTIADSFYIGVLDVESATFLVHREVGTPKSSCEMDEPEQCVVLGFSKEDQTCIAVLGPQDKPTDGTTPILCASNIKKARKVLSSRGVNVGAIQEIGYFEMTDLKGSVIEVSEEH